MGIMVSYMMISRIKCNMHVNCLEHYRCLVNGNTKIVITMMIIPVILLILT